VQRKVEEAGFKTINIMGADNMKLTLKIWRQSGANAKGSFETHTLDGVTSHMSFLEMLDVLNEQIIHEKKSPVAFEHDCREGICGTCSLVINGYPHGPQQGTTTCQLHMRHFNDGDTITIEPWRSAAFPVVKDLVVNRDAFDRIIQSGGYISVNTGQAQDGNSIAIEKDLSNSAMDAATCIGCGACVAACPNASAMLFTAAKVSHLAQMPQGRVEAAQRAQRMVAQHDAEGFGRCSNITACEAECPKEISVEHIARLNREYLSSSLGSVKE
jgi:succinate dehydrogenase / fumarate reductase iron-sulfur subunit